MGQGWLSEQALPHSGDQRFLTIESNGAMSGHGLIVIADHPLPYCRKVSRIQKEV
jgi:hypothetical protein